MIRNHCSVEDVIDRLNQLYRLDPDAISQLLQRGVPCNENLVTCELIEVQGVNPEHVNEVGSEFLVGLLGVINSFFGSDMGLGPIAIDFELVCSEGCSFEATDTELVLDQVCPKCEQGTIQMGSVNERAPFKDLRPAIKEFKETMEPVGNA